MTLKINQNKINSLLGAKYIKREHGLLCDYYRLTIDGDLVILNRNKIEITTSREWFNYYKKMSGINSALAVAGAIVAENIVSDII